MSHITKTPQPSNCSCQTMAQQALSTAISNDSDDSSSLSTTTVVLDAKWELIFKTVVQQFFGGNPKPALIKINRALQSMRLKFILGTKKGNGLIDKERKVLRTLFDVGDREKGTVLLDLLKKMGAILDQANELSPADTKLKETLQWVTNGTKIASTKKNDTDKLHELQGLLLSLLVAVTTILKDKRLEVVTNKLHVGKGKKQFVAYLLQAVIFDTKIDSFKQMVSPEVLGIPDNEKDDLSDANAYKTACKKVFVMELFGGGFEELIDEIDMEDRFITGVKNAVKLKDESFIWKEFVPNEKLLFAPSKWPPQCASREALLLFFLYGIELLESDDAESLKPTAAGLAEASDVELASCGSLEEAESELPKTTGFFSVKGALRNKVLQALLKESDLEDQREVLQQLCLLCDTDELDDDLEKAMHGEFKGFGGDPETVPEKVAAGLRFTEEDFYIVKLLGNGSSGVIFEVLYKKYPHMRLAMKCEAIPKHNPDDIQHDCTKLFLRTLVSHSSLDDKYVVPPLGWFIVSHNKIVDELHSLPNQVVFVTLMEIGDHDLEDFRLLQRKEIPLKCGNATTYNRSQHIEHLKINLPIIKRLLQGLEHFHSHGIIHRDVKTQNCIFVDGEWKFCDFGAAKGNKATKDVGTEGYQAPEALTGNYGPKTDIYSIGAVLYELLTGKLPSRGGRSEWYKGNNSVFKVCKFAGPLLKAFVEKLTAVKPENRPTAEAALAEIDQIIAALAKEIAE